MTAVPVVQQHVLGSAVLIYYIKFGENKGYHEVL